MYSDREDEFSDHPADVEKRARVLYNRWCYAQFLEKNHPKWERLSLEEFGVWMRMASGLHVSARDSVC